MRHGTFARIGVLILVAAPWASAWSKPPPNPALCETLQSVVEKAPDGFTGIGDESSGDPDQMAASVALPGAQRCEIAFGEYHCYFTGVSLRDLERQVNACYPDAPRNKGWIVLPNDTEAGVGVGVGGIAVTVRRRGDPDADRKAAD